MKGREKKVGCTVLEAVRTRHAGAATSIKMPATKNADCMFVPMKRKGAA